MIKLDSEYAKEATIIAYGNEAGEEFKITAVEGKHLTLYTGFSDMVEVQCFYEAQGLSELLGGLDSRYYYPQTEGPIKVEVFEKLGDYELPPLSEAESI